MNVRSRVHSLAAAMLALGVTHPEPRRRERDPVSPPGEGTMRVDAFHQHLDRCAQCANNPFGLCTKGDRLLRSFGPSADPAWDRFNSLPITNGPRTEAQTRAWERGMGEIARGEFVRRDVVEDHFAAIMRQAEQDAAEQCTRQALDAAESKRARKRQARIAYLVKMKKEPK